ncbi:sugar transferase [Novosphingobium gossypii]|uniref:sugar transferase n=1 Tax=Novosphingobium gossypii TaxID=1604774 RepID=UPI003D24D4E9
MSANAGEMPVSGRASLSLGYAHPQARAYAPWSAEEGRSAPPIIPAARSRWDSWGDLANPDHVLARPFDVILASLLIVGFLPMFIIVAIAIWIDDPGPILFAQRRVGRNGRCFPCFKFRSMQVDAEAQLAGILKEHPELRAQWERDHKLPADPRVTRVGRILRVTSLDELPQLFNVLRGEMSIVGPRPIVASEVPRYGRYIHHYYAVRPGLTGLWQVSGRSSVSYRRRIAADIKYARARTLTFDAMILAATIPAVATGRGSC